MTDTAKIETCTSLVRIEPPVATSTSMSQQTRPDASFVTQLIATASGVAQTRALRRGTPADARNRYRVALTPREESTRKSGSYFSKVA